MTESDPELQDIGTEDSYQLLASQLAVVGARDRGAIAGRLCAVTASGEAIA